VKAPRPFPVTIFLELMGLPLEEMNRFVDLEESIIHGTHEKQLGDIRALRDYLAGQIALRRKNPTDDLVSFAITSQLDGQPLNDNDVMGMSFTLFIAGLDTVTSTLSYMFRHLAENFDQQQRLRDNLDLIPDAVEELLRVYNVVTTGRRATRDVEIAGVLIKAGDNLALPTTLASRDPEEFENPQNVDFSRNPNPHSAFGAGPHRCIGSHLARRELTAAVREWLAHVPPFRIAPGAIMHSNGSGVVSLDQVPLVWD
jgi:cytochrome P450